MASELDKNFEEVANQINEKIQEAALLLKEANRLGKSAGIERLGGGYYSLEDVDGEQREMIEQIDFDPLLRELDNAGWSRSSMMCS